MKYCIYFLFLLMGCSSVCSYNSIVTQDMVNGEWVVIKIQYSQAQIDQIDSSEFKLNDDVIISKDRIITPKWDSRDFDFYAESLVNFRKEGDVPSPELRRSSVFQIMFLPDREKVMTFRIKDVATSKNLSFEYINRESIILCNGPEFIFLERKKAIAYK